MKSRHTGIIVLVLAILASLAVVPTAAAAQKKLDSDHPFKILVPADQTGPYASIGALWLPGVKAAISAVNKAGGVRGREVVADVFDTQGNAQTTAQELNSRLREGGYAGIVPAAAFVSTLPILDASARYKTVVIGTGSQPFTDAAKYPYGFYTSASGEEFGANSACLTLAYKPKTVALFHIQTAVSDEEIAGLKPVLTKNKVKVVADVGFAATATNVTPQAQQIIAAKPDVVWLSALGTSLNAAITALNSLGFKGQIVGTTDTSASPASSAFSDTSVVPKTFVADAADIESRIDNKLSASQQTAIDALSPQLNGNFKSSLPVYLYPYDAVQLLAWAGKTAKSDSADKLVKALQTLGKHPQKTGALGGVPGYTSKYHGYAGTKFYGVDITGEFLNGTLPVVKDVPPCL